MQFSAQSFITKFTDQYKIHAFDGFVPSTVFVPNFGELIETTFITQRWTTLKVIHLLSVETAAAATLFLTISYWIWPGGGAITADNVIKHGVNNAVIVGDILLSRMPIVSYHYQARPHQALYCRLVSLLLSASCAHWPADTKLGYPYPTKIK